MITVWLSSENTKLIMVTVVATAIIVIVVVDIVHDKCYRYFCCCHRYCCHCWHCHCHCCYYCCQCHCYCHRHWHSICKRAATYSVASKGNRAMLITMEQEVQLAMQLLVFEVNAWLCKEEENRCRWRLSSQATPRTSNNAVETACCLTSPFWQTCTPAFWWARTSSERVTGNIIIYCSAWDYYRVVFAVDYYGQ